MGVYLPYTSYDYTKMQGPAPDWYHVPSKDEWVALCGILTTTFSMDANATTMGTYLKTPLAGRRVRSSSSVDGQGIYGCYWSSTAYSADSAYYLYFSSSLLIPQDGLHRAYGFSVRCFKNSSVVPDNSWTTLYQWTWSAWIFRNSSLWLISVSWDWTTWYTIMDKNLWATTVFNQWDTLTDANCGYFYQWWNNYGFPHSWTVTTSTTKVDASSYWPGNYYNSSTFIKVSASPYDWSSVQNDNLWWWVTWVSPMSELKNAYIGEYHEWEPDASRTLLYLKLENNVNDSSWNNVSVSSSGISYSTAGDKYYAELTSTTGYIRPTATLAQQIWTWDFTVSFFMYLVSNSTWEASWMFWDWYDSWSPRPWICIRYNVEGKISWMDDGNGTNQFSIACSQNTWHYQTYVRKNWVCYCYLDGAYVWQHNHTINLANPWVNKFYILNRSDYSPQRWTSTWARISEVIFENVAWSANDVQNYYNSIKSNYWL